MQIALHVTLGRKLAAGRFVRLARELFCKQIGKFVVFEFGNRFGENLLIGLVAQIGHETTLLRTQQIPGTANVKILHGNVDSAAQIREILDGLQSAPTVIGQCAERGRHEIAESLLTAATHTTAHLVQIRKPEMLCIVDQNGVRVGDVDTVLDDGG